MSDITKMNLIAIVQKLPNEDIEFIQTCITMLENKITNLQKEKDKYKNVIDKIKEYCNYNNETLYTFEPDYDYEENMIENYEMSNFRENILELLEEVE